MQNMSNIETVDLTEAQRQFIEEFAALVMPWGLNSTAARLYAYLQLRSEPASLDEIAADLQVSKSNASTAARLLEDSGNARRIGVRGSKRVCYVAGNPGGGLRRQTALLGLMAELIERKKDAVTEGVARQRLTGLSDFHLKLKDAMDMVIGEAQADPWQSR